MFFKAENRLNEVNAAERCSTLRSILWFIKMPIIFVHLPASGAFPLMDALGVIFFSLFFDCIVTLFREHPREFATVVLALGKNYRELRVKPLSSPKRQALVL